MQRQCSMMDQLSDFELGVLERSDDGNGLPPRCFLTTRNRRVMARASAPPAPSPPAPAPAPAPPVAPAPPGSTAVVTPIADTFLLMYIFETTCNIQIRAQSGGNELTPIPKAILDGAQSQAKAVTKGLGGHLAWPGLLRKLDRMDSGFRR